MGPLYDNEADSHTICVFADGEVDRCPTGTGSVLDLYSTDRGDCDPDEPFIVESVIGLRFTDHILERTDKEVQCRTPGCYRQVI